MGRVTYATPQQVLHWVVAVVALGMIPVGIVMAMPNEAPAKQALAGIGVSGDDLYFWHKSFGVTMLGLMTLRVIARFYWGKPDYLVPLPAWQRIASSVVHGLLYVLLIAMPVLGWIGTAAFPAPVDFFGWKMPGIVEADRALSDRLLGVHRVLGLTVAALVTLHILAAAYHGFVRRDGVVSRMTR